MLCQDCNFANENKIQQQFEESLFLKKTQRKRKRELKEKEKEKENENKRKTKSKFKKRITMKPTIVI